MEQRTGLRERKKNATWELLKATALELFTERGYDNVSVAEVAAAAEVSKATVFNYFPTKEDLVIGGMKHHTGDAARVVRERRRGQTPHAALREHYLGLLERRAPQTGLSDRPLFLQVQRLLMATPTLMVSAMTYRRQSALELAAVLVEEGNSALTANLVSSQLLHTEHILIGVNVQRILEGEPIEQVHRVAVAAAEYAFGLLENGIGDLMRREGDPPPGDSAFGPDGCRVDYAPGETEAREAAERVLAEPANEILEVLSERPR
ncbi:TetR/AcrR family transcriptional regulator [Glycomyces paridis]|uniref:TetR family transcriptional regulator n=1 Tax=Glycomyces paridis TaxID=2126555 RepID=A0A4S8NYS5_9ACTN|nr:TetR family transcriptional regulator [Glycomyces paridis]THV22857.1 TetR family transcriptional regulator [Glycomyces paridis]